MRFPLVVILCFISFVSHAQTKEYEDTLILMNVIDQDYFDEWTKPVAIADSIKKESVVVTNLLHGFCYNYGTTAPENVSSNNGYYIETFLSIQLKLQDKKAVEDFSTLYFPSGAKIELRIVKSDGAIRKVPEEEFIISSDKIKGYNANFFYAEKYKKIALKNLEPGDILEYHTSSKFAFSQIGSYEGSNYESKYFFAGSHTILKQRYFIRLGGNKELIKCRINTFNGAPMPEEKVYEKSKSKFKYKNFVWNLGVMPSVTDQFGLNEARQLPHLRMSLAWGYRIETSGVYCEELPLESIGINKKSDELMIAKSINAEVEDGLKYNNKLKATANSFYRGAVPKGTKFSSAEGLQFFWLALQNLSFQREVRKWNNAYVTKFLELNAPLSKKEIDNNLVDYYGNLKYKVTDMRCLYAIMSYLNSAGMAYEMGFVPRSVFGSIDNIHTFDHGLSFIKVGNTFIFPPSVGFTYGEIPYPAYGMEYISFVPTTNLKKFVLNKGRFVNLPQENVEEITHRFRLDFDSTNVSVQSNFTFDKLAKSDFEDYLTYMPECLVESEAVISQKPIVSKPIGELKTPTSDATKEKELQLFADAKKEFVDVYNEAFGSLAENYINAPVEYFTNWELKSSGVNPALNEVSLNLNYGVSGLYTKAGPNYNVKIGALIGDFTKFKTKDLEARSYNVWYGYPYSRIIKVKVSIPEGFKASNLEGLSFTENNALYTLNSKAEVIGAEVVLTVSYTVIKKEFTPEEWSKLISMYYQLYSLSEKSIFLKR